MVSATLVAATFRTVVAATLRAALAELMACVCRRLRQRTQFPSLSAQRASFEPFVRHFRLFSVFSALAAVPVPDCVGCVYSCLTPTFQIAIVQTVMVLSAAVFLLLSLKQNPPADTSSGRVLTPFFCWCEIRRSRFLRSLDLCFSEDDTLFVCDPERLKPCGELHRLEDYRRQ